MSEFSGFVFDIDKTAVPNGATTVESAVLREAFVSLPQDVIAIAATGRALEFALPITRALNLRHESVVANGALVVDSQTGKAWRKSLLSKDQVAAIIEVHKPYSYPFFLTGDEADNYRIITEQVPKPLSAAFINDVPAEDAHDIREMLVAIPGVNAYLSPSWSGGDNEFDINIGHVNARKHNALEALFGKYAIDSSKMIGVGDGINDLELFDAVGHRIAVANAHPQLIEAADEIVASQEEDGLAEVVRRFHK